MRAGWLTANQRWVAYFGDDIVQLGDGPRFHGSRDDLAAACDRQTLVLNDDNSITTKEN